MHLEPENEEDRIKDDNEVEPNGELIENSLITYRDLNPIFFQKDDPDIERQCNPRSCAMATSTMSNTRHKWFLTFYTRRTHEILNALQGPLNYQTGLKKMPFMIQASP